SLEMLPLPGQGWLDVKRTEALWDEVFEGQEALVRKGGWVDRPSIGIPYLYVDVGLMLSDAARTRGDDQRSEEMLEQTLEVARAVRLNEIVAAAEAAAEVQRRPPLPFPADTALLPGVPLLPAPPDTP